MFNRSFHILCILSGLFFMTSCDDGDMADQPRYEPLEPSEFFLDGQSARPLVQGTVPLADPAEKSDAPRYSITQQDLAAGRQQYDIFCAACHGRVGDGDGMIVRRGFTPPPSFHLPRLRQAPDQHFFDVITNGYGAMYSYNDRISVADRRRIVAYIRALQLSQNASVAELPPEDLQKLEKIKP